MKISFDLISDLNLQPGDTFDWDGKATSLYCLVAGNISSDIGMISKVLTTLARNYQGVFYIGGSLEYQGVADAHIKALELNRLCKKIRNTAFLHHNVVIIDGVAILGANGWFGNLKPKDIIESSKFEMYMYEDMAYLKTSIEKLQKHLDVKKIFVVTNCVPNEELYFGEIPEDVEGLPPTTLCLLADLEKKVSHWGFGSHKKIVDTVFSGINYVNNPCNKDSPYWAKRIEVEL